MRLEDMDKDEVTDNEENVDPEEDDPVISCIYMDKKGTALHLVSDIDEKAPACSSSSFSPPRFA